VVRAARRDPSAVLLAAQLLGVVLYPFMEGAAGRAPATVGSRWAKRLRAGAARPVTLLRMRR
jgi:hypothetical protein